MSDLDIANLENCVEDARQAALDGETGPEDPTDFNQLRGRLHAARAKLPPLYQETVLDSFVTTLE